jgi:hypothetical protein
MKKLSLCLAAVFMFLFLSTLLHANPIVNIQYQTIDLADLVAGADLWQYQYSVSYADPGVFLQNQAFAVFFDSSLYKNLEDPPSAVADWFTFVLQPDSELPSDGEYDALALTDNPSLANPFSVSFVWLGGSGSNPGSQAFAVNQFDEAGLFMEQLGSGQTVLMQSNVVPEPNSMLLLGGGLCAMIFVRRNKK